LVRGAPAYIAGVEGAGDPVGDESTRSDERVVEAWRRARSEALKYFTG